MQKTLWVWTALCATLLVIAFLGTPAWDTETDASEWFSGSDIFFMLAILLAAAWLAGLGVLWAVAALVRFLARDGGMRAWWFRRRAWTGPR